MSTIHGGIPFMMSVVVEESLGWGADVEATDSWMSWLSDDVMPANLACRIYCVAAADEGRCSGSTLVETLVCTIE